MTPAILIPAFVLGLASSFHCIGMCGPIALMLPTGSLSAGGKLKGILFYNTGRVITYIFLGCLLGMLGMRFFLAGLQQVFSIAMGTIILLLLVVSALNKRIFHIQPAAGPFRWVQGIIARQLGSPTAGSAFITGLANGLLPCGMVYFAIITALATGSVTGGAMFMAGFGLGTMPLMLLLGYFGTVVKIRARNRIQSAASFFIGGIGLLLIVRGLNLDIPYLSPFFSKISNEVIGCH